MRFSRLLTSLTLAGTLTAAAAPRVGATRPWYLVIVYRSTDGGPVRSTSLGPLSASDCQRNDFDASAPPQEAVALKLLRMSAAHAGADALVRVSCNREQIEGCTSAVTCTGEAVQLPKRATTSQ